MRGKDFWEARPTAKLWDAIVVVVGLLFGGGLAIVGLWAVSMLVTRWLT